MDSPTDHATSTIGATIRREGWAVTDRVVNDDVLDALTAQLTPFLATDSSRGGLRHLLELETVRALARSAPVRTVAEAVLGPSCRAVRGILFDKTPDANWKVVWHQDLTIAVREKRDVAGFGPWTEKSGVAHVQPPVSVLEQMVAVRVHLDECGSHNGPVRVIPRSHRAGRLSPADVDQWKERGPTVDCLVARGGILAFQPLLLHASSAASSPRHRRVVHLEYAAADLPGGLAWYHVV